MLEELCKWFSEDGLCNMHDLEKEVNCKGNEDNCDIKAGADTKIIRILQEYKKNEPDNDELYRYEQDKKMEMLGV